MLAKGIGGTVRSVARHPTNRAGAQAIAALDRALAAGANRNFDLGQHPLGTQHPEDHVDRVLRLVDAQAGRPLTESAWPLEVPAETTPPRHVQYTPGETGPASLRDRDTDVFERLVLADLPL